MRPGDNDDWKSLGQAIRERRLAKTLTLVEVAAKSGLSQPFLSQVETGRARPSLVSLRRVADVLGTTPQAFFEGSADHDTVPTLVRSRDVRVVEVEGGRSESQCHILLAGSAPLHLLEFDGLPSKHVEYFHHEGSEVLYVLAGRVETDIAGEISALGPGDSISYPATLPHRVRSLWKRRARVLIVATEVSPGGGPGSCSHRLSQD